MKQANSGDPLAQHELGIRYLLGLGFSKDTTSAIFWINQAAEKNLSTAQFNMGIFSIKGIGLKWDPFEAFKQFEQAARNGFPQAQLAYGSDFIHGLIVNKNLDSAYIWIKKAADVDFEPAQEILNSMLESGYTPPTDIDGEYQEKELVPEKADAINLDWNIDFFDFESDSTVDLTKDKVENLFSMPSDELKKILQIEADSSQLKDTSNIKLVEYAAERGGPEALVMQGIALENGFNYKKDNIKAIFNYFTAMRNGSQRAGILIYEMLKDGTVLKEIEKRANSGDVDAKYVWAGIIAFGYDFSLLLDDALNLLEEAADNEHIPSLIELGVIYYKGEIIEQNKEKAYEYWQQAVLLGSKEAAVRLAITRIFNNDYNSSTLPQLVKTISDAREDGIIIAETALGYCYENGIGIVIDKAEAARLYWNAATKGNQAGYISLKRMYDEVRPENSRYIIYEQSY
ncbi:MAG: hypothetical protein SCALA702_17630 [Melioribacteraceae bacterium]|nr:MAG: hypothetical protein SCALA702_17630 [Melioribacteraceae bacterium]